MNRRTMEQFIRENRIGLTTQRTEAIAADGDDWQPSTSHYKCRLRRGRRSWTIRYHMGPAHTDPPLLAAVLSSIALDCAAVENAPDVLDFASEFGYPLDTPAERATVKRIHAACEKQRDKARAFLNDEYDRLLWETETE